MHHFAFDSPLVCALIIFEITVRLCSIVTNAEKRSDSLEQVHITPAANGKKPNIVMVLLDDWCDFHHLINTVARSRTWC